MSNKLECLKCSKNCECTNCMWFFKTSNDFNFAMSCKDFTIRYGCAYSYSDVVESKGHKCHKYMEINWVDKLKYKKMLELFKKD